MKNFEKTTALVEKMPTLGVDVELKKEPPAKVKKFLEYARRHAAVDNHAWAAFQINVFKRDFSKPDSQIEIDALNPWKSYVFLLKGADAQNFIFEWERRAFIHDGAACKDVHFFCVAKTKGKPYIFGVGGLNLYKAEADNLIFWLESVPKNGAVAGDIYAQNVENL